MFDYKSQADMELVAMHHAANAGKHWTTKGKGHQYKRPSLFARLISLFKG